MLCALVFVGEVMLPRTEDLVYLTFRLWRCPCMDAGSRCIGYRSALNDDQQQKSSWVTVCK